MGDWQCDACGCTSVAPHREPLEFEGMGLCGGCHTEHVLGARIATLKAERAEVVEVLRRTAECGHHPDCCAYSLDDEDEIDAEDACDCYVLPCRALLAKLEGGES